MRTIQMMTTVALLAVAAGTSTVAAEQAAVLTRIGVDRAQGHHFGIPMPPDDLARWLSAQSQPLLVPLHRTTSA